MPQDKKNRTGDRPSSYPKPSQTDKQLDNQAEYIDQQPNSFENDRSNLPVKDEKNQTGEEDK